MGSTLKLRVFATASNKLYRGSSRLFYEIDGTGNGCGIMDFDDSSEGIGVGYGKGYGGGGSIGHGSGENAFPITDYELCRASAVAVNEINRDNN